MDRGLLSEPRLLEASRAFVCARVITYQDPAESAFLKSLGSSATGGLLNTAFAILAPDGKTVLTGTGRSPRQVFRGSEEVTLDHLLATMEEIRNRYEPRKSSPPPALPYLADLRIALNVASCDDQPLVIVKAKSPSRRKSLERLLAPLAWSPDLRGRFAFAHASDTESDSEMLDAITGAPASDAILVVQPGVYGTRGTVIASTTRLSKDAVRNVLERGKTAYRSMEKDRGTVRAGKRRGLRWEEDTTERAPDRDNTRRARRGG